MKKLWRGIGDRIADFVKDWSVPRQMAGQSVWARLHRVDCGPARSWQTRSAPASARFARWAVATSMPLTIAMADGVVKGQFILG